jgi:hypothetical protein
VFNFSDHTEDSPMLKPDSSRRPTFQKSVTEAMLQSYNNSSRLRAVETLVSTQSGHPKITSIALQYEGEHDNGKLSSVCDRNPECDRHETSFHSLPPSEKADLYLTEVNHPTDFRRNISSITVSSKPYNKSQFAHQNGNSDSSKSLFTQQQKEPSTRFADSPFQPDRQISQFKKSERKYENFNPRISTRNNTDFLDTDQTIPFLGRTVICPETEDKYHKKYHNMNIHELFSRHSSKQESHAAASLDKTLFNNRSSVSPVMNEMSHRPQGKKQFHTSILTGHRAPDSGKSSDDIRSISNTKEDIKRGRINITGDETEMESCCHSKILSHKNHKELEGTSVCEIKEGTKISDHCSEREKRHSKMKYTTKYDKSVSPSEIAHSYSVVPSCKVPVSPLYENLKMLTLEPNTKSNSQDKVSDTEETESAILEELTRAADQILQAVNGYTDEESYKVSSDEPDEETVKGGRNRKGNTCGNMQGLSVSLGTITEGSYSKKQQETVNSTSELCSHKSTANGRRSHQRLTKTHIPPTSSTSSVESLTRGIPQIQTRTMLKQRGTNRINNCNKNKVASSSTSNTAIKSSCRTVRLLQRASSREMLLQTYASSSEDVASGVEGSNNRKPVAPRHMRTPNTNSNKVDHAKNNLKKSTVSADSQPSAQATTQPRKRDADINKPRGR